MRRGHRGIEAVLMNVQCRIARFGLRSDVVEVDGDDIDPVVHFDTLMTPAS